MDVAHFAPFAPTVAGTKVDIYLNGSEAITDVIYGNKIPNVMLLPGDYLVEIKPDGTSYRGDLRHSGTWPAMAPTVWLPSATGAISRCNSLRW